MFNRIKEKWKNRKGVGSIEIAISSLIVIMMIAGLVDMINIMQRFDTTSQATNYVSRIIQKQGGVQTNRIENFQGKYTTTSVLYNNVKDMMDANGIPEEDWELTLTLENGVDYPIKPSTNVPLVNFGNRILVTLAVDYEWNMLSNVVPGDIGGTRKSMKEVLSGYQIRDSKEVKTDLEL